MKTRRRSKDGKRLCAQWQSLLGEFRADFTDPGWVRFAQWVTTLVLCDEQHTLTQCLIGLELQDRWHVAEQFAEHGAWELAKVQTTLMQLIQHSEPQRWAGYRPVAVDDTVELRCSRKVWGTCTLSRRNHRDRKQPKHVLGHNWVVMGDLLAGQPWSYLPTAQRLYLRKSQLPKGEQFHTKDELAVQMLQQRAAISPAPLLAIFDGGYACRSMVQPCLSSASAQQQPIAILTRPRRDARLFAPLPSQPPQPKKRRKRHTGGRPQKWGKRLAPPKEHWKWHVAWQEGEAWIYGRKRHFRYRRIQCRWKVSGPQVPVAAYVFQVEGYSKPWYIITSAIELSAQQVVEAYAARFRQEDGIRDHKQQLGMQEVRAWTKNPVLRTFQAQTVAISLLRLLQRKLEREGVKDCYPPTPWNRHKQWSSLRDMRRLLWRYRPEFSQFCRDLEEVRKTSSQAA